MVSNRSAMNLSAAHTLAIQALAYLAGDDEALGSFLAESGLGPDDLRERADDPQLLAGVLDYLLANEKLLLEFCVANRTNPELPRRARSLLPGYAEPM